MQFAVRLHELMQAMQKAGQAAFQRGDFQALADLGQRLKRLDDLRKLSSLGF